MMTRRIANKVATAHRCSRCAGSGYMDGYAHVQGGVCFRCDGAGVDPAHAEAAKAARVEAAELLSIAAADEAAELAAFTVRFDAHYVATEGGDFLADLMACDAASDAATAELGD